MMIDAGKLCKSIEEEEAYIREMEKQCPHHLYAGARWGLARVKGFVTRRALNAVAERDQKREGGSDG